MKQCFPQCVAELIKSLILKREGKELSMFNLWVGVKVGWEYIWILTLWGYWIGYIEENYNFYSILFQQWEDISSWFCAQILGQLMDKELQNI